MIKSYKYDIFKESADYLKNHLPSVPKCAITLGSGLSVIENDLTDKIEIPYGDIPNFPVSDLYYQKNKVVFGKLNGVSVLLMNGRFHYYEGFSMQECGFYVPVLKLLGIKYLILTNAAGGITENLKPGDIVAVYDHIKLFGDSPLRGENLDSLGERFPDLQSVYNKSLISAVTEIGKKHSIDIQKAVYAYMPGPQYETPAEIKALKILGANVVGMSTVPEIISAAHCSLPILCLSTVSNYAAGITGEALTGDEVVEMGKRTSATLIKLLSDLVCKELEL